MSRSVSIADLYRDVYELNARQIEASEVEGVLKKIRRYRRGLEKFLITPGAPDGQADARAALELIDELEKRLVDTKVDKEGPPDISPDEIKYDPQRDLLGSGMYGSVYRCQCRGRAWAVKVPKVSRLSEAKLVEFKKEIHVMKKVYHPNVVLFLGASVNPIMIVTELMQGGDLESLIHKPENYAKLTLEKKFNIALGVAAGMNWLHGICHIIHRDLKPANILLDRNMTPKIADFGFSETLVKEDEHVKDHVGPKGTPRYMAPEIMLGKVLDKSIDVYAYGIILYELMTGKLSFDTYTHYETFSRDICYNRVRPVVQPADSVPAPLVDLMVRCWDERPEVRPTFEDVCADLRRAYYEAFIPQEQPRSFWLENFEDEDAIPYEDLRKLAAARFINLEPLKDVLCDAQDAISMKHFSRLYEWFGPWFCFGEPESTAIINELHAIVAQPWFHCFITKDESTVRLTGNAFGVFLVRLSDTTPGCPYTISYVARTSMGAAPSNFRIKKISHYPARYEASGREFLSLNDIINAYAEAGVLTMACSKSPITTVY